ncbi:hypothetical protein NEOLEDRAFT_801051 [Neolentinus lepideus HHB14362 ss-1]|uniref:Arrestin C-terminal-like domain-containing protein n=1 Tax=Neolentinus lepideus HHB14362 ss-1 TaxID=1314782 RepID=A0A165PHX2_9AGAM|nr:hypothetical protein NEOLEDRAFT_801051 [Neolentinus lepideus HHB14362 ss-1]
MLSPTIDSVAMANKSNKNSLCIRLTESVVFLRAPDAIGRRRAQNYDGPPAMLRGLLTLDLVKPTRIKSIEVELQGKSTTAWPEGVGARRIEITEEHKIFTASTVFFRAGTTPTSSSRRTLSVDPGLSLYHDDEAVTDTFRHDDSVHTPRRSPDSGERVSRRVSLDYSHFQREPVSHHEDTHVATPPYTPRPTSPAVTEVHPPAPSPSSSSHTHQISPTGSTLQVDMPVIRAEGHAYHLEDSRDRLRGQLEERPSSRPPNPPRTNSSASSLRSYRGESSSRRDSMEADPDFYGFASSRDASRMRSPSPHDERGRAKSKRFTFAAVTNVMDSVRDRFRSSSPRMRVAPSRERGLEQSVDREGESRRGRTLEKGKGKEPLGDGTVGNMRKERSALGRVGELLGLEEDSDEYGDGWKEFRKGTYTYPISFSIPAGSPPTLQCEYGSVIWRLKATVHRPGAFKSKLTAQREVTLVACPEEDAEDTENIIVERQWDDQLQYFISISGRTFHIGGTMPVHLTLMPLAKVKVYRISVLLEERVDYLANMKRVARTDPIRRIILLSMKHDDKDGPPLLPLDSDDPDAFKNSPLHVMLNPEDDASGLASSFMGPGPWDFHHELQLPSSCDQINFTNKNKKSNISISHTLKIIFRVERGDDQFIDQKTGKRKMFDIVVQTPVHVLSCMCNPDWIALPPYSEIVAGAILPQPRACPCKRGSPPSLEGDVLEMPTPRLNHVHQNALASSSGTHALERIDSRRSTDSLEGDSRPSAMDHSPSPARGDILAERSRRFERLVAGQESEIGEAPPPYQEIARDRIA